MDAKPEQWSPRAPRRSGRCGPRSFSGLRSRFVAVRAKRGPPSILVFRSVRVNTVTVRVNTVNARVNTVNARVNTVTARVNTVTARVNTVTVRVNAVTVRVNTVRCRPCA